MPNEYVIWTGSQYECVQFPGAREAFFDLERDEDGRWALYQPGMRARLGDQAIAFLEGPSTRILPEGAWMRPDQDDIAAALALAISVSRGKEPKDWLSQQFEFEWCPACGRDHRHHTITMINLGAYGSNLFARCDLPPVIDARGDVTVNPEGYTDE